MARLSRVQLVAGTSLPIMIVLISFGLIKLRDRGVGGGKLPTVDGGEAPLSSETGGNRPKLAITPEEFDGIGKLLDGLGEGYRHQTIKDEAILRPEALKKYEAVFLTCAESVGGAKPSALGPVLRDFVAGGGTLYASDLRFEAVAAAFPKFVDPASVAQGLRQEILGVVSSPELRVVVGNEIPLHFELDGWRPAAFRGDDVDVLIKGKLRTTAGVSIEAPLLVKFSFGKGTVLFTSFHHARKNSQAEVKLLNHLALKTVLARLEAREVDAMAGESLSARATTAVGVDPAASPTMLDYDVEKTGPVQFRLGFEGSGARMRLEVVSPKGERTVKKGESSIAINVPKAAPGRWQYRLFAEQVPYAGFPVLLLVGAENRSKESAGEKANPTLVRTDGNVLFEEISSGNKGAASSRTPRIAVSDPPHFDDMGGLLVKLGKGFQYEKIKIDDLLRSDTLDDFDIFFLTCDGLPGEWILDVLGNSQRQGIVRVRIDEAKLKKAGDTIRRFVQRGGTLYASDLRISLVNAAFPRRDIGADASGRVIPKKLDLKLNESVLPKIMEIERKWLDLVAPSGHVDTILDTLKKAELSPALKAKLNKLVAAVEISNLVKGHVTDPGVMPLEMVRDVLHTCELPATEADATTIARVMRAWEAKIMETSRNRANTKTKALIGKADDVLKQQRKRIIQGTESVGDQVVPAEVLDPGLRELLGVPKLNLTFNTPDWEPALFRGDVTVLLRCDYRTSTNSRFEAPLLVKFRSGQGTVIFTSFHNEAQNNAQEEALLRYLVFTAVTAREEASADETLLKGGFSPAKRSQINHMAGNASITRTYNHPGSGPLRFALIFTGKNARLRFKLVAPSGQKYSKEVESTLLVEATGAPPGEWTYTVEAVKVPYENFPFGVSIGKADAPGRRP